MFKFPFNELEHFYSSLSSSSEKLSFRVQVRVWQNKYFLEFTAMLAHIMRS